jgi:MFS family permease
VGFSGALATRLLDPLITSIASDFSTSVGVVALLASAFALPFGFSQPFLGPMGDAFGKALVIKVATAVLAICLLASALAPDLTLLFVSRVLGGIATGGIMPVCMALIGDSFALSVRQVAMSRYIAATPWSGVSAGGIIAEFIGWRGRLCCRISRSCSRRCNIDAADDRRCNRSLPSERYHRAIPDGSEQSAIIRVLRTAILMVTGLLASKLLGAPIRRSVSP